MTAPWAGEALRGRDDAPDEIGLVDTTIETEWTVWRLMRDGVSFPDEETPFRYRDFKPGDLTDIGCMIRSNPGGPTGPDRGDAERASRGAQSATVWAVRRALSFLDQ